MAKPKIYGSPMTLYLIVTAERGIRLWVVDRGVRDVGHACKQPSRTKNEEEHRFQFPDFGQ